MQLQTLFLAGLALATGAFADKMLTTTACPIVGKCSSSGEWIDDFGTHTYNIDANEGCRNPGVSLIYNLCMDWGNSRGHFNAEGQNQRCLRRTGDDFDVGPCADSSKQCSRQWWLEVDCTWRLGEEANSASI